MYVESSSVIKTVSQGRHLHILALYDQALQALEHYFRLLIEYERKIMNSSTLKLLARMEVKE